MINYRPRPGSAAEAAVEFLRKKGGPARSGEIAEAIGIESKGIAASLAAAVDNGVLVACDVTAPGAPTQKEYRLSAGGKPAPFTIGRAKVLAAPHRKAEAQEAAKPARKPRKTPKPAPAHPRDKSRPKATGRLLRAAAEGQRKNAKPTRVMPVMPEIMQPAVERPQMEPPAPFRCAVFSDGSFEIVTLDRGDIWLTSAETRAMVQYLRTVGHLGETA